MSEHTAENDAPLSLRIAALTENEDAVVAVWGALWQTRPITTENGRAMAVRAINALAIAVIE